MNGNHLINSINPVQDSFRETEFKQDSEIIHRYSIIPNAEICRIDSHAETRCPSFFHAVISSCAVTFRYAATLFTTYSASRATPEKRPEPHVCNHGKPTK